MVYHPFFYHITMVTMKNLLFLILSFFIIALTSCSTVNTTNSKTAPENEVYVFDDASDLNEEIVEEPKPEEVINATENVYIVQVGAFTTKGRAEKYKRENSLNLSYEMSISYSAKVGLFVVQLPPFESRTEAEKVRNNLWKNKTFSDAFILVREK